MAYLIYECKHGIFFKGEETIKCVSMWPGSHATWVVPSAYAGRILRFSAEIKTRAGPGFTHEPGLGGSFYFFKNGSQTALGKYYRSTSWGLVCGNLGPLNEGDAITFRSFPNSAPSTCTLSQNFQVCEVIGQCPGVIIEGLDIGLCVVFGYIGGVLNSVKDFFEDSGDWFEPMWVVGDEIKSVFYAIGGLFGAAASYMEDLQDWCQTLTNYINDLFDLDVIITHVAETFSILTYTTSEFTEWIGDSLDEVFHLKEMWEFISNIDDWLAEKIGDVVTLTADTVADMFEEILDRVFEE